MIASRSAFITGVIVSITVASFVFLQLWRQSSTVRSISDLVSANPVLVAPSTPDNGPSWLLAILLAPSKVSRRTIIRDTWATRFPNPAYEYRFILGNYSNDAEAAKVDAENATFGDIWAIEDYINENQETANHIKNLELFKYMVKYEGTRLRRYDFVSKIDDDVWLNILPYFDAFITPRLPGGLKHNPQNLTIIGRPMNWGKDYVYASGRMYTLSWPLLEFFARKYAADPLRGEKTEDQAIGSYLYEDHVVHEYVPVELEQAWDIGMEYLVNSESDTLLIHEINSDETLLEVSTIFDERGRWNGKHIPGLTNFDRNMKEVIERIGEPSQEESEQLKKERNKSEHPDDPWASLDWKLIQQKINIEDREAMGSMYPLNLPGNNVSTGVTPRRLGWCAGTDQCAH